MKRYALLAVVLAASVSTPALAGVTVFSGNTTGGLTYNRALTGRPPTGLSGVGTAVRYSVNAFNVTSSGNYNFLNSASGYDAYLGIHQTAFNPLNALQNAVAYDDDAGPGSDSAITALALTAGVQYFAVSSGFGNTDFGAFTLTIDGPGNILGGGISAVPEPATWAMMIAGFGLVGGAMRRRVTKVTYA